MGEGFFAFGDRLRIPLKAIRIPLESDQVSG
jgi:hypothetical protein